MSTPLLSIHLHLDDSAGSTFEAGDGRASIVPLAGTAEGKIFSGSLEPGGICVTTKSAGRMSHITAHYVIAGRDAQGNAARVFVTNESWVDEGYESFFRTSATFVTDNVLLKQLLSENTLTAHGKRVSGFVDLDVYEAEAATIDEGDVQGLDDIEQFELVNFKKGHYLVKQGEKVDYVYFLAGGSCKVYGLTPKGEEVVYDMREAKPRTIRCFIGGLSACRPDTPHRGSFQAASECYAYRLSVEEFKTFLIEHPRVFDAFMAWVMDRYAILEDMFLFKQTQNAPGLVASVVLGHVIKAKDAYYLSPEMTNSGIARFAGANRVTVVRIMQALEREGVLEKTEEGTFVRDLDRLRHYASGELTLKYKPTARKPQS